MNLFAPGLYRPGGIFSILVLAFKYSCELDGGGDEGVGGKVRRRAFRWGLPPLWSSLWRDGGACRNDGGRRSAGSLMIYLDPGAPVPVSHHPADQLMLESYINKLNMLFNG